MTINSYLHQKAEKAVLRGDEKDSIRTSIGVLSTRLTKYFGTNITKQFIFGSFDRGTILPRSMDARSDVDYMIVFTDTSSRPQTYLDRLRRFVEIYYSNSEIAQSHPTIQLNLNHIRFELVPAIETPWMYKIPAPQADFEDWIISDPVSFKANLVSCNTAHANYIKPTVRLLKYWNAHNSYPFQSYELEQLVVNYFDGQPALGSYWKYFSSFALALTASWDEPQWVRTKVDLLHSRTNTIQQLINSGREDEAVSNLERMIP